MSENAVQERQIGSHIVIFTEPDHFLLRFIGDANGDELIQVGEFFKLAPRVYLLVDATQLGGVSAGAQAVKKVPISSAISVFGATTKVRLALSLMQKAYMMVNLGKSIPMGFFETEPEARQWLEDVRSGKIKK